MNYAVAFLTLIFVFATGYWYAGGRKFYTGPRTETLEGEELQHSPSEASANNGDTALEFEKKAVA